jgi:hypothetical protein
MCGHVMGNNFWNYEKIALAISLRCLPNVCRGGVASISDTSKQAKALLATDMTNGSML